MRGGGGGLVTQSCLTLATPWTVACQTPLSMGFSRQEYWSGLPFPSPGDLPDPGIKLIGRQILYTYSVTQLCLLTLCDSVDCSTPGSSVHRILQAGMLKWVAISSSRGSSRPRDQTHISWGPCTGGRIRYQLGSLIQFMAQHTPVTASRELAYY